MPEAASILVSMLRLAMNKQQACSLVLCNVSCPLRPTPKRQRRADPLTGLAGEKNSLDGAGRLVPHMHLLSQEASHLHLCYAVQGPCRWLGAMRDPAGCPGLAQAKPGCAGSTPAPEPSVAWLLLGLLRWACATILSQMYEEQDTVCCLQHVEHCIGFREGV